ncbi:MAG: nuclear transport factor 2 family protein [Rhodobacteraceae bacterium]|nr:nuclear transport factor 2 family protein [Paracoccaceae bacterium]
MSEAIETFFAAWGETDPEAQERLIDGAASGTFYYADPNTPQPLHSLSEFLDYVTAFSANMPGAGARVATVSQHHDHARATVEFTRDGAVMMRGQYFADLDAAGKIERMVGFAGMGD